MELYRLLDFTLDEPDRFGNNTNSTKSDLSIVRKDVKISTSFNAFLKNKSVIIVGPSPYLKGLKEVAL